MEPDLDRLIDFESHGGLFPQFDPATWETAYAGARALVDKLRALGGPGRSRVALRATHTLSFASIFLAFAREEVDLFLFNPTWGKSELAVARRVANCHGEIEDSQPGSFHLCKTDAVAAKESVGTGPNPLRVMIATGGSSGRIRFAIHNWSTLAAATYGFQEHLSCDRMAAHCVLPLYHVSGFMQLVRALLTMGSVVFGRLERFTEGHRLLERERPEVRFLSLVATQLERLLQDEELIDRLREYRAVFIGGGPAPIGLLEAARTLGLPLAPTYGMTETAAQVATLLPSAFLSGAFSQGKALPHVRIEIVDREAKDTPVKRGEVGLIKLYGSSLFLGYYGELLPKNSHSILTSDLGSLDERGNLTVMGRADRVVISGGEKVNLREVELAFERSGMVKDVFCFGREDREWGEALTVAYVPRDPGVTELTLKELLSDEMAHFKIPKTWIRLQNIPRNEAGKPLVKEIANAPKA